MAFWSIMMLTFREIRSRKVVVGLFAVATFVWVMLTFALNLDVVDGGLAAVKIFGNSVDLTQEYTRIDPATGDTTIVKSSPFGEDNPLTGLVVGIQTVVAGVAYWMGLLLALFATGGLLASIFDRGAADLLLSKPVSRPTILMARLSAIWLTVLGLVSYLLLAVWVVMSLKSGLWHFQFLLAIGLITLMFVAMYGVVTLVSVLSKSGPLSLIVTFGLIFSSLIFTGKETLTTQINPPWRQVFLGFYHVLPNFAEVTANVAQLTSDGLVSSISWYPVVSTCIFGGTLYLIAFVVFSRKDF